MIGDQWRRLLARCGLDPVTIVADSDPHHGEPAQSVIIGHRSQVYKGIALVDDGHDGHWLICADQGALGVGSPRSCAIAD